MTTSNNSDTLSTKYQTNHMLPIEQNIAMRQLLMKVFTMLDAIQEKTPFEIQMMEDIKPFVTE